MLGRIIKSLIRKVIFLGIALGILLTIGYFASDHKDYPGRKEFEKIDSTLNTNAKDTTNGDSDETRAAASAFASKMKTLQSAFFTGGSGHSFATGGNFLTYIKHTPNAVIILCHVPELRNYKDEKTRDALALIAWTAGQAAAKKIPGVKDSDTLIIGLRGFALYGPIWEGTVSGDAAKKTDDDSEKKRLYPFFAAAP